MSKEKAHTEVFTAYEDYVPFDPATPERNLLRAILMSAMNDVKKTGEVKRQAREFFLSPEEDYIFSFQSICSFLEVDPKSILLVTGLAGEDKSDSQGQLQNDAQVRDCE